MSRPKYHKWTTAEDQTLRRLAGEGKRSAEIARALGLRTAQVYHYAHDHEISVRTRGYIHTHAADVEPRPWTDSELMMLALDAGAVLIVGLALLKAARQIPGQIRKIRKKEEELHED